MTERELRKLRRTELLEILLELRSESGTLPKNPIAVKTIVTTEICRKIAADEIGRASGRERV